MTLNDPRIQRLITLIQAALFPPPGKGRITLALIMGALCHLIFAMAVLSMMAAMFFGMSESFGRVSWPWAILANAALIVQFPLLHSFLLSKRGTKIVARLIPGPHGGTLASTTYAIIASLQLAALFLLWTPSGIIWYRADGTAFVLIFGLYAATWLLLLKASFDAGAEVQSGALGWMSLLGKIKPVFPEMPTQGLFRLIRQPIYVAFALTLWAVPVWTPDQLALAISYTAYCLIAPRLKEKRFEQRYGAAFDRYRDRVPYIIPRRTALKRTTPKRTTKEPKDGASPAQQP
jgi:protein-S-isoprenylcysteine O-methyltransferase Ste14